MMAPGGGPPGGTGGDGGLEFQALGPDKVATTAMDFSKLTSSLSSSTVTVSKKLVQDLMTPGNRKVLSEESGAIVEWVPDEANVVLQGSAEQVKKAQRLLSRVMMHCRWGYGEEKVARLLKPQLAESVICRLSPMSTLKPKEKTLRAAQATLSIGKDKKCDVTINDALISRQHAVIELDEDRGAVYVLDCSTNGTFLNGLRLPSKSVGKVLLSHGDELLLKDPKGGEAEFGFIVNLNVLQMKEESNIHAGSYRRILTAEEQTTQGRDYQC